ncbi:hypothetical protein GW17_00003728 [Ensete ventricosum]|nr:hypothetical protein GW17_00003728 [Ensete ventricosum]
MSPDGREPKRPLRLALHGNISRVRQRHGLELTRLAVDKKHRALVTRTMDSNGSELGSYLGSLQDKQWTQKLVGAAMV